MRKRTSMLIVPVVAAAAVCAGAEVASSQPAEACARRAAAAAFADLTGRLLRLPMTGGGTVGQWIGSRTDVDLSLRRAAYELRQTRVVSQAGANVCQVEVSVVVSELARAWARQLRQESLASGEELEQIREWSVQAGLHRLTAGGVAECPRAPHADGEDAGDVVPTTMPAGWEHLPPEALDLARHAAAADAAERMRARCRELQLRSGESLGDVFDLYGQFEDAFLNQLERRLEGKATFEPFGVCRMPAKLSVKDIAGVLGLAVTATPGDQRLARLEFGSLTDPAGRSSIAIEGIGTPPPTRLAWPGRAPTHEAPTWATETLTAIGQGSADTEGLDPDRAREAAIRHARLDAIRNMWLQIDELIMPDRRRVRDAILAHPEIGTDLAGLEERMWDVGKPEVSPDGRASVKVMMPLAPLWDVLARAAASGRTASKPARRAATRPNRGE